MIARSIGNTRKRSCHRAISMNGCAGDGRGEREFNRGYATRSAKRRRAVHANLPITDFLATNRPSALSTVLLYPRDTIRYRAGWGEDYCEERAEDVMSFT
jgi:hypothetical protein